MATFETGYAPAGMAQIAPLAEHSARWGKAVTPSDTDQYKGCRGVFVGTGGHVAIKWIDPADSGNTVTITHKNVPSGAYLPIGGGALVSIMSTNTTATDMVVWF